MDAGQGTIAAAIAAGAAYNEMSKEMKKRTDAGKTVNHKSRAAPQIRMFTAVCEHGATEAVAEEGDPALRERAEKLKKDMRGPWDEKLSQVELPMIARAAQHPRARVHRKVE
eukprot:3779374-Pyramimonas_sp.AAC.1